MSSAAAPTAVAMAAAPSSAECAAAACLGYDEESWDEGLAPELCMRPWKELTSVQASAALVLGYSEADWDAELEEEIGAVAAVGAAAGVEEWEVAAMEMEVAAM